MEEKETLDLAIRQNVIEQVELLRGLEPVLSRMFESGEETITRLPKFKK